MELLTQTEALIVLISAKWSCQLTKVLLMKTLITIWNVNLKCWLVSLHFPWNQNLDLGISASNVPPSGVVFALIAIAALLISHVSSSADITPCTYRRWRLKLLPAAAWQHRLLPRSCFWSKRIWGKMKRAWSHGALEVVEMADIVGCVPAPTGHVPCCLCVSASEHHQTCHLVPSVT